MSWSAVRTITVLELRQRVRSTRWRAMLITWAVVLTILSIGLPALATTFGAELDDVVPFLYDLLVCFVLGIGLVVAPTLSAMSINGDRADATLALVQATAVRPREIAVGKLLAAWLAALAFLAVAAPFLVAFTIMGGATLVALLGHLAALVLTLGSVCAIGLGLSARAARTSASAVLTYLVVAALVVGTPLAMAVATPLAQVEQRHIMYEYDPVASTVEKDVCSETPTTWTDTTVRGDRIWWLVVPNPFVVLADISARTTAIDQSWGSPLTGLGLAIDSMRNPPELEVVYNPCEATDGMTSAPERASHVPHWPVGLAILMALGAVSMVSASRALRTPAGRLPRGIRIA